MQARGRGGAKPAIGIAIDGDYGNRIDAVLALAMLNGLTSKNEARRVTLSVSRAGLGGAQLAEVVTRFYTPGPVGATMIGVPGGGPAPDAPPPLVAAIARKSGDGTPIYTTSVRRLADTPESAVLIRNLLLAQVDGNAAIVVGGPASGVVRLLDLAGARPQLAAKVRYLVVAAGRFGVGGGSADPSITADVAAAKKLFAEWPTPIVAVGSEVGEAVPYPGASIEKDFSWAPEHPVVDAYRLFKAMPYDAPASALAALLYAAHPEAGHFKLSEPGTIRVLDSGRTEFTPGAAGKHRHLIADLAQKDLVTQLYTALVTSRPAAPAGGRAGRGAPPAAAPRPMPQEEQDPQQQDQ